MRNGSMILAVALALTSLGTASAAGAQTKRVTVTVENLAPPEGIAFAPLRVGFGNGSFDAFDTGEAAGAPIISVAEGGSGSLWFPAFAAAEPGAVLGTVGGLLLAGQTASASFRVDALANPFFTFGSMVVPSNDHFIGNEDPREYRLFDAAGNLRITSIGQTAGEIWNAGSELFDPAAAAFLQGGNNDLRTAEGGVVRFEFAELAGYDGLFTGAGYRFTSGLSADTPIYRISFSAVAVPEPSTWLMMILGFGVIGAGIRRSRRQPSLA